MASTATVRIGDQSWHLCLTDFNRLRWTIAALRLRGAEGIAAASASSPARAVFDSTVLQQQAPAAVPDGAWIVLWDGLNSVVELHERAPALRDRPDLRYFYVGYFEDLRTAFPAGSLPLLPVRLPVGGLPASAVRAPLWVSMLAAFRAAVRPLKNARLAPALHRGLQQGGQLVFCGLVRPGAVVLDGFLRGSELPGLREALSPLDGLDWRGADVKPVLHAAYGALRSARPRTAADLAALYSVASVMHRLGTLAALQGLGAPLFVNEYGMQAHFDPYDARAYERNLFIDFGSTRGGDDLYPRTLDLLAQRKHFTAVRWLQPGERLAEQLARIDADGFLALCEAHARQLLDGVAAFHRSAS
jgi:hypothetical protein